MTDHPGRRARNRSARAAFDAARERGLAARKRAKLARGGTQTDCPRCGASVPLLELLEHLAAHTDEKETE